MCFSYLSSNDITIVVIIQAETDQITWETQLDMPQRTHEEYLHPHKWVNVIIYAESYIIKSSSHIGFVRQLFIFVDIYVSG